MAAAGDLTDEERRALRGSKFAPLPAPTAPSRPQPRMAHPGGPLTTNKAAALAKFLERKLQQPDGLESLNPDLVKLAVRNAKETIKASKGEPSTSGRIVRHVSSFGDSSEDSDDSKDGEEAKGSYHIAQKDKSFQNEGEQSKKKKKNKKKNLKAAKDSKSQKASKKKKLKSL
uniref:Uncharacterized protein n=1 Tax=Oryza barthii TaxID=65489 RepID=A0A0D3GUS7_9ORYZ